MDYIPCSHRRFPYRINFVTFYSTYLHWLRHLVERIGYQQARAIWDNAFAAYDDQYLINILSSGWQEVESGETTALETKAINLIKEYFPLPDSGLLQAVVKNILEID